MTPNRRLDSKQFYVSQPQDIFGGNTRNTPQSVDWCKAELLKKMLTKMPTWITMNVTEKYVKYKYVLDM